MLVATFGSSTAWAGREITRESELYVLADHGPISAADVLAYERRGHLVWADESLRLSVEMDAMADAAAISEAHHRWAAGEVDTVLVTPDDGEAWHVSPDLKVSTYLTGVAFADARHGWTVSNEGHIFATADGGATWELSRRVGAALRGVACSDAGHAWAVGDSGVILTTEDGSRWTEQRPAGAQADLLSVVFSDRLHGWAAGMDGAFLATSDGGRTWLERSFGYDVWISAIACSDAEHVWAAAEESGPVILASGDGGATWSERRPLLGDNQLFGIVFADPTHGWAVGDHSASWRLSSDGVPTSKHSEGCGVILATADGGLTWSSQITWSTEWLRAVAACDALHAWAVGPRGTIEATRDGGDTWEAQESGCREYLIDVACTSANHAWAVGEKLVVAATTDGGRTWSRRRACGAWSFATEFSGDLRGWAVGNWGALATTDGGRTWHGYSEESAPQVPRAG